MTVLSGLTFVVESRPDIAIRMSAASAYFEILSGFLAAVADDFVLNGLTLVKGAQPSALDGGDVDENVLTAALRLDEPVALGGVEPFHCSGGHDRYPLGW